MQSRREGLRHPPPPAMGRGEGRVKLWLGGGCRGAAPSPSPPAPSTYWLSSLAACKERETGHGPPTLDTANPMAPGEGGEEQRAPTWLSSGGGWWIWGPPCSPWGSEPGSGQAARDRGGGRTAGHQRGDGWGRTSPSMSQILPPPGDNGPAHRATGDNTQLRDRTRPDGPQSPTHWG